MGTSTPYRRVPIVGRNLVAAEKNRREETAAPRDYPLALPPASPANPRLCRQGEAGARGQSDRRRHTRAGAATLVGISTAQPACRGIEGPALHGGGRPHYHHQPSLVSLGCLAARPSKATDLVPGSHGRRRGRSIPATKFRSDFRTDSFESGDFIPIVRNLDNRSQSIVELDRRKADGRLRFLDARRDSPYRFRRCRMDCATRVFHRMFDGIY
jgi:hypothetical protein